MRTTMGSKESNRRDARASSPAVVSLVSILSTAFVVCACSSSTSSAPASSTSQTETTSTASTTRFASPSTPTSHPPSFCPNPEGSACLGELSADQRYTTKVFGPRLTYRVPISGWFNYEDTPGNFLLVPPKNDLPGVNAGTADFLGVYTAIAPARIIRRKECETELQPGAGTSPKVMAAWFRRQPDLVVSSPEPVRVGGLRGVVLDLRTKPGAKLTSCTVGGQEIIVAGLFSGVAPSSLDHAVIPGMTMRLFLLSSAGNVLGIELDDIDQAPGGLDQLTATARRLEFDS